MLALLPYPVYADSSVVLALAGYYSTAADFSSYGASIVAGLGGPFYCSADTSLGSAALVATPITLTPSATFPPISGWARYLIAM